MYRLRVETHFDAAHKLLGYPGECANLHGHRWRVIVSFDFSTLQKCAGGTCEGIAQDFKVLKEDINAILPDHTCLNDLFDFNPTAENIARWIYERLYEKGLPVHSVEVYETPACSVLFLPDGNED